MVEEVGDVQGAAAAAERIRFSSYSYDLSLGVLVPRPRVQD